MHVRSSWSCDPTRRGAEAIRRPAVRATVVRVKRTDRTDYGTDNVRLAAFSILWLGGLLAGILLR